MIVKSFSILILTIALNACVSIPTVLEGSFSNITPASSKVSHKMNLAVRWSGYIVNTVNKKDKTCFEIVQTQTEENLRPINVIPKNSSRFLSCKDGFMEPQAFNKRMVTVTGNLVAFTKQNIGDYEYEYPVVKTDIIYIWRKQQPNSYFSHINTYAAFANFHCGYSYHPGYCY